MLTVKVLAAYLLSAMLSWSPLINHVRLGENENAALIRYQSIANDVAEVTLNPDETPATGIKTEHWRVVNALMLISIAYHESNFWKHIDEGDCKKFPKLGNCDNFHAFTMWQIHPDNGIFFDGDVWTRGWKAGVPTWRKDHEDEMVTSTKLVTDRKLAAKMALHMIRFSVRTTGHLGLYSGEGNDGPKAKLRYETAKKWFTTHKIPEAEMLTTN